MSKISIDIENVKNNLINIGYEICDCNEKENNGKNWQLKFSNSGAIVTIYDTNNKRNSVVNGKADEKERKQLKEIVDGLKCKELNIDPLNRKIVELINKKQETFFCDYKEKYYEKKDDLLQDILFLSNNTENCEAYIIVGVTDNHEVVGIEEKLISNNLFDFLKGKKFAGDHMPDVEVKNLFYLYHDIGVIICKKSKNVPFFLTERYKSVPEHRIFTRVGDTNTPKNSSASYCDIEKLWQIHFG